MMLCPNIKLNAFNNIDLFERITINSGVENDMNTYKYLENSYSDVLFPRSDWKPLTFSEFSIIKNSKSDINSYKEIISIFKTPIDIQEKFEKIKFYNCKNQDDIVNAINKDRNKFSELELSLVKLVQSFEMDGSNSKDTSIQGFYFSDPGLPTVALDKHKKIIGLHIDYSIEAHKLNIENTVNRMSINLGEEPRYFIFINLSVSKIMQMIKNYTDYDFREGLVSLDLPSLTKKFFEFYPNYPMIKLRIDPYEGYIAPSDNIIHDGSTLNMIKHDVTLNFLGHFLAKNP